VDNWTPAMPNPPLSSLLHDEICRLLRQVASRLLQSLGIRRWKALLGVGGTADAGAEVAARQEMTFAAEQSLLKKVSLTTEGFHRWLCSDANAALARKGVILLQLRD
jgi:exopolyphosphatase/pppGpp-phosphohydrolase